MYILQIEMSIRIKIPGNNLKCEIQFIFRMESRLIISYILNKFKSFWSREQYWQFHLSKYGKCWVSRFLHSHHG